MYRFLFDSPLEHFKNDSGEKWKNYVIIILKIIRENCEKT